MSEAASARAIRPYDRPTDLDARWEKPARYNAFDRFWLGLIRDERDLEIVYTALSRSAVVLPLAALLYISGDFPWWAGLAYIGIVFKGFMARFVLMLHCVSHRALFKKDVDVLNHWIPVVMGPFFGQTPYTYYSHHMGIHHPENNLYDDLSSTMKYQRDKFGHFLLY